MACRLHADCLHITCECVLIACGLQVLTDDLPRLRAAAALPTRTGNKQTKVVEDIWMEHAPHACMHVCVPSCA